MRFIWSLASFSFLSFCSLRGGEIIEGDTGDGYVTSSAVNDGAYDHLYTMPVGTLYSNSVGVMIEPFALPYLAPGQTITAATLSFYLAQASPPTTPPYNLQLYGLQRVNASNSIPLVSDWFVGSNDSSNTLLNSSFITPSSACNRSYSYSGTNLIDFIKSQYANPAFSGMNLSKTRYIFFRINADGNVANNQFNAYSLATARNPDRAQHPLLTLTISGGIVNTAGILQFSFNLPQNAVTSAGVYDTASGALIRTLWNNVQYQQGLNYGVWDGKNDGGVLLPTGSNYQIRLAYHNVQYVWEGMIGNTSANQTGSHVYRALGKIHDMSFTGTTAYYSVGCNESAATFHSFTAGNPQVPSSINMGYIAPFGSLADPFSSIYYVTSDGVRSYWAKVTGGFNGADTYVFALNNAATGASTDPDGNINSSLYTFPQGQTPADPNQRYSSCVDLDNTPGQPNPASGIAVQQAGNDLFVSHANLNIVRVFDKVRGNFLGSFSVTKPGRLQTTANGDVWVISNSSPPTVLRYRFTSSTASLIEALNGLAAPVGLGVSADDSLLLVADGGSSQQIKAFNNASGAALWTYGEAGGMAVSGPTITTGSFNFSAQEANSNIFDKEAFIAFQPDGTFWIEDGGNGRVLHFSIHGSSLTYIEQIAYNDVSYCSTVDLTDVTRVFNGFMEYSVNYSLPPGGTNGSWTLVRNWFVGLPYDATHCYAGFANGIANAATLSNGRTYALLKNMLTNNFDLYELPSNGPARSTGTSFSTNPRIYADGTLRYNVTSSSQNSLIFYSQALTGFDGNNDPLWGPPATLASTPLASGDPIPWNAFPMRTEITANGTVLDFDAYQGDLGYHLAGLPLGGNAWEWHASPSTAPTYTGWFPQDGKFDVGNGVQYAGDQVMTLGRNIVYGYHGEFWQAGEASQWVNFLEDGLMIGRFGTYGNAGTLAPSVNGFAGNAFSPTLVGAPNGKTYLYHNDETNHGGTVRWRIDGWDQIAELSGSSTVGTSITLGSPSSGPVVEITSPTQGATYVTGNIVTCGVEVGGTGASLASVQFLDGSTSLGTVSTPPFALNCLGLAPGSHVLEALATATNGITTTSAPVYFTVMNGGAQWDAANIIDLNFSGGSDSITGMGAYTGDGLESPKWNNITGATNSLITSSGAAATGVGVSFTDSGTYWSGTAPTLLSQMLVALNSSTQTVTLTGLTPKGNYQLYLYGQNGSNKSRGATFFITTGSGSPAAGSNASTVNVVNSAFVENVNYVIFNVTASNSGTLAIGWTQPPAGGGEGDFNGLQLVPTVGSPAITSATTATAIAGMTFSYAITGSNSPTSYSASGLPADLILDPASGVISGIPTIAGTSTVQMGATNIYGTGSSILALTVCPPGYRSWIASFNMGGLSTSPADAPLKDGVPNLMKYVFGIDPSASMNAADRAALPKFGIDNTIAQGTTYLTLTFGQSQKAAVSYVSVQISSDLQTWTNPTLTTGLPADSTQYREQPTGENDPNGDPYMKIEVPFSGSKEFIRLNVSTQ